MCDSKKTQDKCCDLITSDIHRTSQTEEFQTMPPKTMEIIIKNTKEVKETTHNRVSFTESDSHCSVFVCARRGLMDGLGKLGIQNQRKVSLFFIHKQFLFAASPQDYIHPILEFVDFSQMTPAMFIQQCYQYLPAKMFQSTCISLLPQGKAEVTEAGINWAAKIIYGPIPQVI